MRYFFSKRYIYISGNDLSCQKGKFFDFLNIYSDILIKNGYLEFKTDNDSLYNFTIEQLNLTNKWEIVINATDLYNNTEFLKDNIPTEYETKFHLANKNIYKIVIKNLK